MRKHAANVMSQVPVGEGVWEEVGHRDASAHKNCIISGRAESGSTQRKATSSPSTSST